MSGGVAAQQPAPATPPATPVFDLGEIVVVGRADGQPGVGGAVLTSRQIWSFDRKSLDQAVNMLPGVVSTFDANGRRNESDVFVRGFGRWQVPLMVDGVRIYLPADNRLDFSRFLTADVSEIQIQKGYASVLDGPGAMGGAINLVTRKPTKALEAEASIWTGGRSDAEGWNGYFSLGTRQPRYYVHGSANYSDRDWWTLSGNYQPDRQLAAARRPAGELRHVGLALQRQGRLDAEPDRRVHGELHQADGREGRPAERVQQPARAAQQLLAVAVLGHPEHVVPVPHRSSAGRRTSRPRCTTTRSRTASTRSTTPPTPRSPPTAASAAPTTTMPSA